VLTLIAGRVAVEQGWQGKNIGRSRLPDAVPADIRAAEIAGIRTILVHATSEDAERFDG
jgi:hypothetical protein